MIAGKPQPAGEIVSRRQRSGGFRKADVAGQDYRRAGEKPRHRAILLRAVLHGVLHEACGDRDGLARGQPRRQERPGTGTGKIVADRGAGTVDHLILTGLISRGKPHATEFIPRRRQRAPLRGWRQRSRRCGEAFGQLRDQRMLLGPALQLPDPEADQQRQRQERENSKAGDAAPSCGDFGHHGSRSISRPSAALWWNCSAINSAFIERSGSSVIARISGSQRAACSQNGGWYFISTISAQATTMAPAIMMMNTAGPSPESMKA